MRLNVAISWGIMKTVRARLLHGIFGRLPCCIAPARQLLETVRIVSALPQAVLRITSSGDASFAIHAELRYASRRRRSGDLDPNEWFATGLVSRGARTNTTIVANDCSSAGTTGDRSTTPKGWQRGSCARSTGAAVRNLVPEPVRCAFRTTLLQRSTNLAIAYTGEQWRPMLRGANHLRRIS